MPSGIYIRTEKAKKNMSLAHIGLPSSRRGKIHSKETRIKISKSLNGNIPWNKGLKGVIAGAGKPHPWVARGESHYLWIKDRTKLAKHDERNDMAYKNWRIQVIKRDGVCRMESKICKGYLTVHHILGWAKYPEERYNINNGITLCQGHHPRKRVEEQTLIPMLQELVALKKY